jgi:quercetin dioxygenase-like cupin family protein
VSQQVVHPSDEKARNVEIPSYVFDDRHIRWHKMGDFEHFEIAMLDVDVSQKIVDFLIKFEPNQQIFLHRHTALANTLVIQGEHRLYKPNGALKEVRRVGSYTSSPPGDPHREGGGEEGGVVFYSIRAEEGTLFEVMDDTLNVVGTLSTQDFINAWNEQKNA